MKINLKLLFFIILPLQLLLLSCQKDNNTSPSVNGEAITEFAADELFLQSSFNTIFDDATGVDDITAGEELGIYGSAGAGVFGRSAEIGQTSSTRCFTVTVTPRERGVFPKIVTLDFGAGCQVGGHTRKGKIIFNYSGRLHIPGKQVTTTFENYMVDSFLIEGKHILMNTATAGTNQKSFSIIIENGKVTNENSGRWWTRNSNHTMIQTEGNGSDFFPLDDVFSITGKSSGEKNNKLAWESEITAPVIKKFGCKWLVAGIAEIRVNNTVGILNYGNGECDNTAILAINGASRTLTWR